MAAPLNPLAQGIEEGPQAANTYEQGEGYQPPPISPNGSKRRVLLRLSGAVTNFSIPKACLLLPFRHKMRDSNDGQFRFLSLSVLLATRDDADSLILQKLQYRYIGAAQL